MNIATDDASYTLYEDNEREDELAREIFKYLYVTPDPDITNTRVGIYSLGQSGSAPPLAVKPEYEETVIRLLKEKAANDAHT